MSSQTPDVNALLHNMHAQILALTTQLAELQANPPTPAVEKKFNKKVEVVADPGAFEETECDLPSGGSNPKYGLRQIGTHLPTLLRMQECYTAGVWPTWDDLKVEIKKYFKPHAERDWAR
ncbi:hypothetical protein SERLA73DRAFT_75627 [Serpula lacrymans var. lacrymans S7.3]|uniref:Retrotransposon gag domain-containing protein n=2 Tax=Serpula lacrymans var. lacrymans TaxID=341189 RepID=F8Q3Q9_SERL3|nr:uncharacterized protein SERLADRAFT_440389 [Serpula lacrymans var. lacrymans S7.9]EGN96765.1 hypothetical protein SERLA73DRAFT_75627 [Serpula lacrymans var. lacrymans S7.3]EGO22369.1 hypothetical protein SERLADRAFT_440389 [Serpula lacrymans var. lacrymans S7.9]